MKSLFNVSLCHTVNFVGLVRSSFFNEKLVWYILSVRVSVTHEFCSRIKVFRIRESREWKRRDEMKRQDDQKHLGI